MIVVYLGKSYSLIMSDFVDDIVGKVVENRGSFDEDRLRHAFDYVLKKIIHE